MSDYPQRDGASQQQRTPAALRPGYFQLDELTHEQLLAMAADYAGLLHFHGQNGEVEAGAWERIFLADEALILARILTVNLVRSEAEFRRFITDFRRDGYRLHNREPAAETPAYRLAALLDAWSEQLRRLVSPVAAGLSRQLADMIECSLAAELQALLDFLRRHGADMSATDNNALRAIRSAAAEVRRVPAADADGAEKERFLRNNFHAFYKAVALLKNSAVAALKDSLASQSHGPTVGLYMAFLHVYGNIQGAINRFTERHLDFYYRDLLRFAPLGAVADSAYLLLAQDGAARHVTLPQGTAFSAGVDAQGQDVIFTADHAVQIGVAQVADLRTLYFERNALISPEREFGFATSGKSGRIEPAREAGGDGEVHAWPLLGAAKADVRVPGEQDARLGFAIASPVLLLKEGRRDIAIAFDLELEPDPDASRQSAPTLGEWLKQLAEATHTTLLDAFFKAFREMFRISLTSRKGWLDVTEYFPLSSAVEPDRESASLSIQLRLPPEADPIQPYSAVLHGDGYDTDQPIIRFTVNPTTYLYPYSLLARLIVRRIDIEVAVKGLRDVLIYNNLGQLNANSPFNPFGPIPMLGGYFIVGAAEAARKRLTDLEFDIEWGGLPSDRDGLAGHYAAYDRPYDDAQFQVRIAALKGGKWLPAEAGDQPVSRLFAAKTPRARATDNAATPRQRTLSCRSVVSLGRPSPSLLAGEDYAYGAQAKDAFFKLTLSAPEYAFGHRDYPLLLTEVLTANARVKKNLQARPIPQPPYTPLIDSFALNYRAVASLSMADTGAVADAIATEKLFHLHPFGVEAISARNQRRTTLVPRYPDSGNLFIGLAGEQAAGLLSLFFHLRRDSMPSRELQPSEPSWSYLADNRWQPLDKARVQSDGTKGFLAPGIVVLDLPPEISRGNSVMPADLFWLRLSVARHPETLCSAYAVHAQALRVSRRLDGGSIYDGGELAAGSIKTARAALPGIVAIRQPVPSSGGRSAETDEQFKARVGERLRHKNRATLAWDFERLILQRFPQIYLVKCFPNLVAVLDPAKRLRPGALLIVVVPQQERESAEHMQPLADRLLLREIHDYVAHLASPFARIEVRNPTYEQIQLRCSVKCDSRFAGDHVAALNQAITDYLSPWRPNGAKSGFDWRIRRHELEAFIGGLPYIEHVTNLSLLRVAERDHARYTLDDTVEADGEQPPELGPIYPWSIAVPFRRHAIETLDVRVTLQARRTGIGEIEIGSNLILTSPETTPWQSKTGKPSRLFSATADVLPRRNSPT